MSGRQLWPSEVSQEDWLTSSTWVGEQNEPRGLDHFAHVGERVWSQEGWLTSLTWANDWSEAGWLTSLTWVSDWSEEGWLTSLTSA